MPLKFRTAAKKWFQSKKSLQQELSERRTAELAHRPKDAPLRVLDVREQMLKYGLEHLPSSFIPSHADLNAHQRRVEKEPEIALPWVELSSLSKGELGGPAITVLAAIQRLMVTAALTGAFGQ